MARLFDDTSSEYLQASSAVVLGPPATLACWFRTDATEAQSLISIGYTGAITRRLVLVLSKAAGGQNVAAQTADAGQLVSATSAESYVTDVWQHAGAVFESDSNRRAALDGQFGSDETTSRSVGLLDETMVGALRAGSSGIKAFMSGSIAEAAIWNVALTAAEMETLAAGYSPLCLAHRRQNLVLYHDLIRPLGRPGRGPDLTATGTAVTPHPRLIAPAPPQPALATIVPKIDGPFCVEQADVWTPTVVIGQVSVGGLDQGEVFSTGDTAGEVHC